MAPLEEIDDSTKGLDVWHGAGLVVKMFDPYYRHQGFIFIPLSYHDSGQLRVQHLMSKLMLRCQCPSRIRHQLVPSL
jgi:hypothetical protein